MKNAENGRSFAQRLLGLILAIALVLGITGTIYADESLAEENGYGVTEENGYDDENEEQNGENEYDENEESEDDEDEYPYPQVEEPETITARPSAHTVLVDGELVAFRAFNINDENFFMLRDIAYTLSGSYNQFEVEWDDELLAISLTTSLPYTPVGGEMSAPEDVDNLADAWLSTASIYVDGEAVYLLAYNVGGNNFFRLRDLGEALGFDVDWDAEAATVLITTAPTPYAHNEEVVVEDDEDDEDVEDDDENESDENESVEDENDDGE